MPIQRQSTDMTRYLALLLTLCPFASLAETPSWWRPGVTYIGEGVQSDGQQWSIELTPLSPDLARISYPSIPCAGQLRVLSSDLAVVVTEEMITENRGLCITGGQVQLWQDKGGILRFDWSHGAFGLVARGTLTQPGS
jgi:hypothetical protein